jgi:transcription antitermination factor NusA-like protein
VQWDADPAVFVASALSPAQVVNVDILEEENTARVVVPERQLSLAIGKEGQNARLAAKLTGWRIDIRSDAMMAESPPQRAEEAGEPDSVDVTTLDAASVADLGGPEAEPGDQQAAETSADKPGEDEPAPAVHADTGS